MNVVLFNDSFKPIFAVLAPKSNPLESPLIRWDQSLGDEGKISPQEFDDAVGNGGDKYLRLPFESFRIFGVIGGSDSYWGNMENCKMVVWRESDSKVSCVLSAKTFPGCLYLFHFNGNKKYFDKNYAMDSDVRKEFSKDIEALNFSNVQNRFVDISEVFGIFGKEDVLEAEMDFKCSMLISMLSLIRDFQNPHFHLCRKAPQIPRGKSVIWQKQREHFVLLHKSHPANKLESHGRVIDDEPQVLKVAHSRRAHWRILKSARFKHKLGQKIWIRSMWVGPKEWTDRSGQIYQIINRL